MWTKVAHVDFLAYDDDEIPDICNIPTYPMSRLFEYNHMCTCRGLEAVLWYPNYQPIPVSCQ